MMEHNGGLAKDVLGAVARIGLLRGAIVRWMMQCKAEQGGADKEPPSEVARDEQGVTVTRCRGRERT